MKQTIPLHNLIIAGASLLAASLAAFSAENAPPAERPAVTVTDIVADSAEFNVKSNVVVFRGSVRVNSDRFNLRCRTLTTRVPPEGGFIEQAVAEGDVAVELVDPQGKKIRGRAGRIIYTRQAGAAETNEIIQMLDGPVLETDQGSLIGEEITYDRLTGRLTAPNARMVIREPEKAPSPAAPGDSAHTNTTTASPGQAPESTAPPTTTGNPQPATNTTPNPISTAAQ